MPETKTYSQEIMDAFWEWLPRWYSPEEIETIKEEPGAYLAHFIRRVSGTEFDPTFQPDIGAERKKLRVQGEMLQALYPEIDPEEVQKRKIERLRAEGRKGVAGLPEWWLEKYKDEPELGAFIERREAAGEARTERRRESLAFRREEAGGFEAEFAGVTGPQPWQDWFERQFPSIVSKFRTAFPFTQEAYEGLTFGEAQKKEEKLWPEFLTRKTTAKKEEYATRFPFGPQGRPWAMAPRITTVGY